MTKQEYNDVREQIGIQNNICTYLKNIKEVMDAYPQLKGETLQDVFRWLLDRHVYWENNIKKSCDVADTKLAKADSVNEITRNKEGNSCMNINEVKVIQDDDGDYNLHVTATMADTSSTLSSLKKEVTIEKPPLDNDKQEFELNYNENPDGGAFCMDIDLEKLGLKYLGHHRNSDGTVTIKCSCKEPEKDLTSDTFEVSPHIIHVSYDRSQCVYGPDSSMSCILCSRLCPERAKDLKKAGVKVEYILTEKDNG